MPAAAETPIPDPAVCERARLARDPRFDGRFFTAVLTTGIYCRPICPARAPKSENVRYFSSAAAAQEAGYRPCLRCRPESARRPSYWRPGGQQVVRALRLIDAGYLNEHRVGELAARLGMSERHLTRLFRAELGATPAAVARVTRVELAKRLLDRGNCSMTAVAMLAGFGSLRAFNHQFQKAYGASPSEIRRGGAARGGHETVEVCLPIVGPYQADWMFDYFDRRALYGTEEVDGHTYRRLLTCADDRMRWLEVEHVVKGTAGDATLKVRYPQQSRLPLADVLARVRRMFDLDADSHSIDAHLGRDATFADVVERSPGVRLPGAWDGFETAVRAILGQQVSVDRATALAAKLMELFDGAFPTAAELARVNPSRIGMPRARGAAIQSLAQAVEVGEITLDDGADSDALAQRLHAIAGIGPWTAGYIALRVARDPDTFLEGDWGVLKALQTTPGRAKRRASAWSPWRGYAVMYLWRKLASTPVTSNDMEEASNA